MSNKLVYTKIQISHEIWKKINTQREPNETMSDTISRIFDDFERYKKMVMNQNA